MLNQAILVNNSFEDCLFFGLVPLWWWVHSREEVGQKRKKQPDIVSNKLGKANISNGPVDKE